MNEFVWIVYEVDKRGKETIFGVFSSETLAEEAADEFDDPSEYKIERYRLNP